MSDQKMAIEVDFCSPKMRKAIDEYITKVVYEILDKYLCSPPIRGKIIEIIRGISEELIIEKCKEAINNTSAIDFRIKQIVATTLTTEIVVKEERVRELLKQHIDFRANELLTKVTESICNDGEVA